MANPRKIQNTKKLGWTKQLSVGFGNLESTVQLGCYR